MIASAIFAYCTIYSWSYADADEKEVSIFYTFGLICAVVSTLCAIGVIR